MKARFSGRLTWSAVARHRFGFVSEFRRQTATQESQNRRPVRNFRSLATLRKRRFKLTAAGLKVICELIHSFEKRFGMSFGQQFRVG